MPTDLPPVLVLALLLVLIGTQVAYIVAPHRPGYLIRLGISVLALMLGEVLGTLGVGGQLTLGELHPVQDLALLGGLQWLASWWARRRLPA